ncbi:MAG: HDIG domain-containing protein, partial [Clostridia bacterium]|nr:HDIG domain-containing protein [Clostridia bacterium]
MTNTPSLKVEKWKKKDAVKIVSVFLLNFCIMFGLFLLRISIEQGKTGFYSYVQSASNMVTFGVLLLFIVGIIFTYYFFTDRDFIKSGYNTELVFLIIELSYMACFALGTYVSMYLIPFTLAALLALFLINKRSSIFINAVFGITYLLFDVFVMGVVNVDMKEYVSVMIAFVSGTLVAFLMDEIYSRIKLFLTSFLMSVPIFIYSLVRILSGMEEGNVLNALICSFFAGPSATVIFIILLPFFEILFRKVTSFKLAELTDHKHPLIARLIREAPGTFNHSIIVSNIAEACATAIGEDALFARTCAYYHDMGKLRRPEYSKIVKFGGWVEAT